MSADSRLFNVIVELQIKMCWSQACNKKTTVPRTSTTNPFFFESQLRSTKMKTGLAAGELQTHLGVLVKYLWARYQTPKLFRVAATLTHSSSDGVCVCSCVYKTQEFPHLYALRAVSHSWGRSPALVWCTGFVERDFCLSSPPTYS